MRFLRMFTNSLLAGVLCAAYLTVLVLQLNPSVPLFSGTTARWFLTLSVSYGLHFAILFYVVIVLREFFSMDPLSPGWASVRVLAWLSAAGAAVASVLMWLNVSAFAPVLGELATRRMLAGTAATAASALALLAIALAHYSHGRRGGRVGGALFIIAAFGSIALPLVARGPAVPRGAPVPWAAGDPVAADVPGSPRITMLLFDGASLEYIRTRATEGKLPNFGRVLDGGASMYLATLRPTQPGPVWAAAATGMYPAKNGIRSAASYFALGDHRPVDLLPDHCFAHALLRLGIIRDEPHTSAAWRVRPLWGILTEAGVPSGIVGWPITYPAQPSLGFVLADRFHDQSRAMAQFDGGVAYPAGALRDAMLAVNTTADLPPENGFREQAVVSAARRDWVYSRAMHRLNAERKPRLTALRFQALDTAGHWHHGDSGRAAFRGGQDEEQRLNAQQVELAYAAADAVVGEAVESLSQGDLLLLVSGFGMQRLNPMKELLARGLRDPATRGTHERAPDGFLIAYGTPVHPGRLPRGSIVDVTPTVLYVLGLPIGRDMDGFARTDLFNSDFTAERPIAFIGTHDR